MKSKTFIYLTIIGSISISFFLMSNAQSSAREIKNYVPNAETAVKIAEAIWLPIYGESIYSKKPFTATLKDSSVWIVTGHLSPDYLGGVPYIEIRKKDCKILKVTHGK